MSSAEVIASSFTRRRAPAAPLLLLLGSLVLYIGVAFSTGQTRMLEVEGVVGLLQRMVALGIVAIGHPGGVHRPFGRQFNQRRRGARLVHHAGQARDDVRGCDRGARGFGHRRAHQRRARFAAAGQSLHSDARLRPGPARFAVGELHEFCRLRANRVSGAPPMGPSAPCPIR
jgi:hypothetical protein